MKKLFTTMCAALLTVAASAQVTATISPSTKNVFTPSEYEYVSVTYGDTLDLSSAEAIVAYGTSTTSVPVDSTTTLQALFDIDAAITSLNVPDGGVFTVSVSNVSGANSVSASYKYYATVPTPTASTADGSTLDSKATDVTFTFSSPMVCQSIGFASGSQYNTVEQDSVLVSSVTASILESYWDSSSASITVSLDGLIDADGYSYPTYDAIYYYAETVNYLGLTADPSTYTYQQVYDELWTVGFIFDKEVVIPEDETPAYVTFYNGSSELDIVEVSEYDVTVDYDAHNKYYIVNVLIPEVPSSSSSYTHAIVELDGFTYGGSLISQPSATYKSSLTSNAKKRIGGLSGINNTSIKKDVSTNVYNLQGTLLKSNAKNISGLSKGIYIINGRKIVVK